SASRSSPPASTEPPSTSSPPASMLAPSQLPPQAEPSLAQAGRSPTGAPTVAVHVPSEPGASQRAHCPSHADSQQTPSTQRRLSQASSYEQAVPFGCLGMHWPFTHWPLQSPWSVQLVGHVASTPLQR